MLFHISLYDDEQLFKDTIDEILNNHKEEFTNIKRNYETRMKKTRELFGEVKSKMLQVWKEEIDDEELFSTISHRIYKFLGHECPY